MSNSQHPGTEREVYAIVPLFQSMLQQAPSHIKLVSGIYDSNEVKCPAFRMSWDSPCRRLMKPTLILKHHVNPHLQLWCCEHCEYCLIKVNTNGELKEKE